MSAFLGKIHFWLFNKIKYAEDIEKSIILWGEKEENRPLEAFKKDIYEKYGMPLGDESLENIIDTSNIHGWLQNRIRLAELRQASLVTNLLGVSEEYINPLKDIFKEEGFKKGEEASLKYSAFAPEDLYATLNDYLLEGMPCDNVDRKISSNENEFKWLSTRCLHRGYWEEVGGDINNFYILRDEWIKGFVNGFNSNFSFEVENFDGKRLNAILKLK